MTAEVVNLRRARKLKQRVTRADMASGNRVKHGRTAAERKTAALETARATLAFDGHRMTPDDGV